MSSPANSQPEVPAPPLIELRDASVTLEGRVVLEHLNWKLERGVHTAILGGNGAGKSTFLRLIAGQLWPVPARSRLYGFGAAPTWTPLLAREKIALLSPEIQEVYVRRSRDGADNEKGWQLSVRETIATGFFDSWLLHQTLQPAQWGRVHDLIEQFALHPLSERPLLTLSQGQLRRVLLARALVKAPAALLLDEACSGLDRTARQELLESLETLAQSGATTLVMTTHRRKELIPSLRAAFCIADHTLHPLALETVASSPPRAGLSHLAPPTSGAAPLFRLENVSVFLDGAPILRDLSWQWPHGTHWGLSGANGSGKSTFLRLLRGQLAPAWGGVIERWGETKARPLWEWGRDIALLSPQLQAQFGDQMSVETAIATGFFDAFLLHRALTDDERTRVEELIARLGLEALRGRIFGKLSYGQTRRVLLARALVTKPCVLLLDEALDGLDAASRHEMNALLARLVAEGLHLGVVSHHDEDFPPLLTHHLHFEAGRIGGLS